MTDLLVLRPEPGARRTVERAAARGLAAIATPLFAIRALAWSPPDPAGFDALMLTSAQAVRFGGPGLDRFKSMAVYAVGEATAGAAGAAGFADVRAGDIGAGDAAALIGRAQDEGRRRLLHLCGRDHRAVDDRGIVAARIAVYAADAADRLAPAAVAALAGGAVALLHSPRAAELFARLVVAAGLPRGPIAAISDATAAAAGPGWPAVTVAATPTDEALLAAAARLCEKTG